MQLYEKIRKLEEEKSGTYKDQQETTMQILGLTKKLRDVEIEKKELENKLSAAQEYNKENAAIILQKVQETIILISLPTLIRSNLCLKHPRVKLQL